MVNISGTEKWLLKEKMDVDVHILYRVLTVLREERLIGFLLCRVF